MKFLAHLKTPLLILAGVGVVWYFFRNSYTTTATGSQDATSQPLTDYGYSGFTGGDLGTGGGAATGSTSVTPLVTPDQLNPPVVSPSPIPANNPGLPVITNPGVTYNVPAAANIPVDQSANNAIPSIDVNAYLPNPTYTNPLTGVSQPVNQAEFATPAAAGLVASLFGGTVVAPSQVTGEPAMQQIQIPGIPGTQNAGGVITTLSQAAQQPHWDASLLANNPGDNPSSAVNLIGSWVVPTSVYNAAQLVMPTPQTNTTPIPPLPPGMDQKTFDTARSLGYANPVNLSPGQMARVQAAMLQPGGPITTLPIPKKLPLAA